MIKGIGCDIVDLNRINDKLANKILTAKELKIYENKKTSKQTREFLGGRFAGKEAFFKAVGIDQGLDTFCDIEILNDAKGKPYLNYPNSFISIAHENDYAIAYVVVEA